MATSVLNTFSSFSLSRREVLAGSVLTEDQANLMQNELSQIAEQRLALDFDPANSLIYAQNEAFLKGQMSVYRVLLDRSKESEKLLQTLSTPN